MFWVTCYLVLLMCLVNFGSSFKSAALVTFVHLVMFIFHRSKTLHKIIHASIISGKRIVESAEH